MDGQGLLGHQRHDAKQVQDIYFAENRVYSGYDETLKTGPYNFGWASTKPDWVERFPYQNGMLVWFANGEFADNNTSRPPGWRQVLPVDARPAPIMLKNADGTTTMLGNRRQPFDATFGQEATDAVTLPPQRRRDDGPVVAGDPDVRRLGPEPLLDLGQPVGVHQGGRLGHDDDRGQDHGRRQRAAGHGQVQVT